MRARASTCVHAAAGQSQRLAQLAEQNRAEQPRPLTPRCRLSAAVRASIHLVSRTPVYLHIYDLLVMNYNAESIGLGVYHTGVQIYEDEYCFSGHNQVDADSGAEITGLRCFRPPTDTSWIEDAVYKSVTTRAGATGGATRGSGWGAACAAAAERSPRALCCFFFFVFACALVASQGRV